MFILPNKLEQYDENEDILFYFYKNSIATSKSKIHFNQFCISIGICGSKKLRGSEGIEEFSAGDIIIYKPGNYISYENIDNENTYESLMIFFNEKMVLDVLKALGIRINQVSECLPIKPYYSFQSDIYLKEYLNSIVEQLKNKPAFSSTLQKIKLLELFVYLQAVSTKDLTHLLKINLPQQSHAQLEKIIESINIEQFPLDELAFMCNMSLSTFKRVFLKKYGINPGKWLSNKRLEKAAEQIKLYGKTPFEVFADAGYKDYSSFSYAFKKRYGYNPKNYTLK